MTHTVRLIRKLLPLLLAVSLLLALSVPAFASSFGDVSGSSWYAGAVDFVSQRNLFQGTADGVFSPNETMTRAMFITVLGRYAGIDPAGWNTGAYHTFSDVSGGSYYAGYAVWAYENDIVQGDGSPDRFSPDKNVTREQACAILSRFAAVTGRSISSGGAAPSFSDSGSISSWARDSVYALSQAGIIRGRDTGAFDPAGCATRAEAAAIIQRFDAASGGTVPPAQQGGSAPPAQQGGGSPPAQLPSGSGLLANTAIVSHLSQGDRYCCLATCFSMAANVILGQDRYGAFDWTGGPGQDWLNVPSGTCFTGTDGVTYYPNWSSGGLSESGLRSAIDNSLNSGLPIIASVQSASSSGTHYVLFIGWTDESHSDYLISDPSGGGCNLRDDAEPLSESYRLGNKDGTFVYINFIHY